MRCMKQIGYPKAIYTADIIFTDPQANQEGNFNN